MIFLLTFVQMGGFTLIGPNYVFQNLPNAVRCRCLGYEGQINSIVENFLYSNPSHELNVEALIDISPELAESMQGFHLGDNMHYSIKPRVTNQNSAWSSSQTDTIDENDKFIWKKYNASPTLPTKPLKPWHR